MPVKGGGGIGGPRKTAAPKRGKSSVGKAVKKAGAGPKKTLKKTAPPKPTPTPGRRSVGKTVTQTARREVRKQETKKALKQSVEAVASPAKNTKLQRKQSTVSRVLLGDRSPTVVDTSRRGAAQLRRERPTDYLNPKVKRAEPDKAEAAALKVLNETLRPARAVGESLKAGKGDPLNPKALKAGAKALVTNKGDMPGKVIVGDSKSPAAGAARFALDVALDPTTYVTAGSASVARQSAQKAGAAAAKKAAKAGMTKAGQDTVRRAAEKRAAASAPKGKGVTVKFAGKQVPGVTRATAKVARKSGVKVPQKAKEPVSWVNPRITPEGAEKGAYEGMRRAERRARASRGLVVRKAMDRARLSKRSLKPAEYAQVVDAIERKRIGKLPEELRDAAVEIRSDMRYQLRQRRRAGVPMGEVGVKPQPGDAKGYFPHMREDKLKGDGKTGKTSIGVSSTKRREDRRPISAKVADPDVDAKPSTNIPLVRANYTMQTAQSVAAAKLNRDLADLGRPAKGVKAIKDTEGVYHLTGGTLKRLDPKKDAGEIARAVGGKGNGRYVILNDKVVDEATRRIGVERTKAGAAFDTVQGKWKAVATATPGFHVRNLVGDSWMGYMGQRGRKMPQNAAVSAKALKRLTTRERHQADKLRPAAKTTQTVKVAGERVNVDDFLDGALEEGVIRSAQRGRELEEFKRGTGPTSTKRVTGGGRVRRAGRAVDQAVLQNREDWMRLATYKDALDRGKSKAEAADEAMKYHIDYGDVTEFERTFARRVAPFYTFTARALPMHAKTLVQKPGKFANLEKARQEVAYSSGLSKGWEDDLPEYKQRAIPFGVSVGGKKVALDAALPVSMLNEVPSSLDPVAYAGELGKFGISLVTPLAKIPAELGANRSYFFRRDIESEDYPLVAAPTWAGKLPKELKDRLGVVDDYVDRRSGKTTTGWPGRVDYLVKQVPGLPVLINQLATDGALRSGRSGAEKWVSATGVKVDPVDPVSTRVFNLLAESRKVNKQLAGLGQRGKKGGRSSEVPEVRALSTKLARIDAEIYKLSLKRGDKQPLRENVVPKKTKLKAQGKTELQAEFESFQRELKADPGAELRREYEQFLKER